MSAHPRSVVDDARGVIRLVYSMVYWIYKIYDKKLCFPIQVNCSSVGTEESEVFSREQVLMALEKFKTNRGSIFGRYITVYSLFNTSILDGILLNIGDIRVVVLCGMNYRGTIILLFVMVK